MVAAAEASVRPGDEASFRSGHDWISILAVYSSLSSTLRPALGPSCPPAGRVLADAAGQQDLASGERRDFRKHDCAMGLSEYTGFTSQ